MEEWNTGRNRGPNSRVPNNSMERGWSIRRINENGVEEKLQRATDPLEVSLFLEVL